MKKRTNYVRICTEQMKEKGMQKIIKQTIKKYIGFIFIISIFIVINMYVITLPAKIIGKIIDLMSNIEQNKQEIILSIFYLVAAVILYLLTRLPWRALATFTSRSFERELKNKIFSQFIRLKMVDLQNIKNGEFMSYFTKDVSEIRNFFFRMISYAIRILVMFFIVVGTMISNTNLKLTIITLCPIILTGLVVIKLKAYVQKSFKKSQQYFTELSEYVQESTDSIRTIKAYAGEYNQLKEFMRKNERLKRSNNTVDVHSTLLSTSINLGFGICYTIALLLGSQLVLNGEITIGDFTAFNAYIGLFYGPVYWIPGLIQRYKRAQISYKRLDTLFQLEREKINLKNIKKEENLAGDIEIKNLSYNYPTTIEVALKNINLKIPKGKTLGVIGTIGSGKTTLMNLLMKLYTIPDGKITIGGKDINEIPTEVVRNNICYITQEHFLFSTTLKENITLFREGYDEEEVIESTTRSMLKQELQEMKNGIETVIGERGVDLSGGQKQRVILSRAFLQKSNIIILDDAFSALDNKTEEQVLENVRELTKDKTCIIVSNRISDIKEADEIIVLEEGEIIQRGIHKELIEKPGLYRKFYEQQSSKEKIREKL